MTVPLNNLQPLLQLMQEVESTFSHFQKECHLPCPTGCGDCCNNPEVEATITEMIPMAQSLITQNKALSYLEYYEQNLPKSCMIYQAISDDKTQGYCSQYATRPLLCRAFAVSGVYTKNQTVQLSICKKLKEVYPHYAQDEYKIAQAPIIAEWYGKLSPIDPLFYAQRMPISQALYQCLHKLLTYQQFNQTKDDV